MIEHCIAALNRQRREDQYHVYMSDLLRVLAMNSYFKDVKRYADYLYPPKEEKRAATDVVSDITKRAGLKVVN